MNLAHPEWLLIWIVVPILAIAAILIGRFRKRPWEKLAAERLRGRLIRRDHPLPRWLALCLLLAAILALVFTLARPQGDAGVKTEKTMGRNVMIALDLSRSMRVTDVKPDRLSQAKVIIYELLETLQDDRVGLIGFAGTPFLSAPLTIDHSAVRETVEQIDEEWISRGGSDIASAVKLATQELKETGQKNNMLILLSDGEENEGDLNAIVREAESAGVTIFAIGVGTEDGSFVPHPDFPEGLVDSAGNKVLSRLQPEVMRKLAKDTGGRYVIAGGGTDIPAMVELTVQGMDAFEVDGGQTRVVIEFFQWALLPAIIFLMASIVAGTRWRRMAGAAAASVFLLNADYASADRVKDAREAFYDKRFDDARDGFRSLADVEKDGGDAAQFRLGEGLSAYEAQDFRGARMAYSEAMRSDDDRVAAKAHEGMGNTLFQLGWMGLSGSRYGTRQEVQNMEKFDALVREQIQRMADAEIPEDGDSSEFDRLESILLNWTDAVRHYQSATAKNPSDDAAVKNSGLTIKYLKRMREILQEEKDKAEQEMPQQGEGEPKEGEGSGEPQDKESEGDGDEEKDGSQGEKKEGGEKGSGEKDGKQESGGNKDKDDEKSEGDDGADPNETPEEHARRILEENSDIQKGPVSPGRREFRSPEKDW